MEPEGSGDKQEDPWRVWWMSDEFQNELTTFGRFVLSMGGPPQNTVGGLVLAGFWIGIPIILANGAHDFSRYLAVHNYHITLYVFIGLIVMIISIVAYRIRSSFRFLYGLLELIFGILVSLLSADPFLTTPVLSQINPTTLLPFGGGIYICIRGLNNIEDGLIYKKLMHHENRWQNVWWTIFHKPLLYKQERVKPPETFWICMALFIAVSCVGLLLLP